METTGRRTGHCRLTPAGKGLDGAVFWLIVERGAQCGYVQNVLADPWVRGRSASDGTMEPRPSSTVTTRWLGGVPLIALKG
ncbi:MAG: nitroreductase family deazaflavin-dependent oxidoreductase [Mycobacteriaceae bacterium]|nr:nitroreductase family deazaflavin-dependent oxidoreductase [Mycobacteriaceae bacterium]